MKVKLYFSHGSNHSCGVMVLVRGDLEFEVISINSDDDGRSIAMEAVGIVVPVCQYLCSKQDSRPMSFF